MKQTTLFPQNAHTFSANKDLCYSPYPQGTFLSPTATTTTTTPLHPYPYLIDTIRCFKADFFFQISFPDHDFYLLTFMGCLLISCSHITENSTMFSISRYRLWIFRIRIFLFVGFVCLLQHWKLILGPCECLGLLLLCLIPRPSPSSFFLFLNGVWMP